MFINIFIELLLFLISAFNIITSFNLSVAFLSTDVKTSLILSTV